MAFDFTLSPYDSLQEGEKLNTINDGSGKTYAIQAHVAFDGTQANADVIPLGILHGTDVVYLGGYGNDTLTGMTDIDIGLYTLDGVAVDADLFVDGDSLATAQATPYGDNALSAAAVSAIEDRVKKLGDVSAAVSTSEYYVLALTLNAAGSASGDFVVKYEIIRQN